MAEYFEREALIKELSESVEPFNTGSVFRAIRRQPAADVAPVVHGRWIRRDNEGGFPTWTCSRCGHGVNYDPEGMDLYCYHCGAKMDGDREAVKPNEIKR